MHSLALGAALAAVWLLLSGYYDAMMLAFGVASCLFATWLAARLDAVGHESVPLHLWRRLPGYWLWLLAEIAKANWDVGRRILDPRLPIDPRLFELPSRQRSDLTRVVLANSITLTPGTIAVDVRESSILVHALTAEGQAALETGEMDARVAAL